MPRRSNPKFRQLQLVRGDPDFDRAVRQTPRGMMHWAGSCADPDAVCGSCQHFQPEHQDSPRGRCGKHHDYTRKRGDAFDRKTLACKYFENAPPDVEQRAGVRTERCSRSDKMDLSKYTGSSFVGLDDVRDGPIVEKIVNVVDGEYGKPNLIFESGCRLSVNKTNTKTLIRLFGKEGKNAIGQQVELYKGPIEVNGTPQDSVLIGAIPSAAAAARPATAAPKKRGGNDPISSGPQSPLDDGAPPHTDIPDSGEDIPF
jgi:hypothetical protein